MLIVIKGDLGSFVILIIVVFVGIISRVVTWSRGHVCRGTSVARSLKLLALPHSNNQSNQSTIIILSTNRSYVISPCVTNSFNIT